MANRSRSKPNSKGSKRASAQKKADNTTVQAASIVVILLVIAAITYALYNNRNSGAKTPAASTGAKQYASAPAMTIDTKKQYFATVKMAKGGEFQIQLFPDKAPITVNSFVFLAREKFFDGVTFHRVLEGFMAQGGDPTGTGTGGPGYSFVNENSDLKFDKAGVVAMANAGPDTNGSQFFITFGPTPQLNGGYTIFGQVISGMDVVNGITRRDPNTNPTFSGDAIQSVTITEK